MCFDTAYLGGGVPDWTRTGSMFNALLEEADAASAEDIEETISRALETKDQLWRDQHLYRFKPVRCSLDSGLDYVKLAMTYFDCLKRRSFTRRRLIGKLVLFCIADLPDVFNGTTEQRFFEPLVQAMDDEGLLSGVQLRERLQYPPVDRDVWALYKDPRRPEDRVRQLCNEAKFFRWLVAGDSYSIRSTLGIISLTLLGLYTRSTAEVENTINGELYLRWGEMFAVEAPPAKIAVPADTLRRIEKALGAEHELTERVLAMCLRMLDKLGAESRYGVAFAYLVAIYRTTLMSRLDIIFELAHKRMGLDEAVIRETLQTKTTLKEEQICKLYKQLDNYFLIMRYVAYCYKHERRLDDQGLVIRTRYYKYAPLLGRGYFDSIMHGNYELRSFFAAMCDLSKIPSDNFAPMKLFFKKEYAAGGRVYIMSFIVPGFEMMERVRLMNMKDARKQRLALKLASTMAGSIH